MVDLNAARSSTNVSPPLTAADSRRTANRTRIVQLATILVVAAVAFVVADAAGRGPHFNPDESRWLSRAHYLSDLLDPFGPTWDDQYMTRGQPPLGSYFMGMGLLIQGRDLRTNPPWNFSVPWEINIALGRKPVAEDLAAGRRTSAALVALSTLALIGVARVYVSTPWSIAAGALFAVHPFTIYIGSLAMSDALFGLLIALAAWAAAAFARHPDPARAALVGVLLGLGGATKLSPLAIAAGVSAAGVVLWVVRAMQSRQLANPDGASARYGLLVGGVAIVTFVASYPYLWPDPVDRTSRLFAFRAEEMAAQSSDWPEMAVPNRIEALRRVNVNFAERFTFIGTALSWLNIQSAPALLRQIEFLVPVLGIIVMASMAIRDGPYSPRFLALAVLGGSVLITLLGMRSEFDRYHVPMALLGPVAAATFFEHVVVKMLTIGRVQSHPQLASARQN